MNKFLVAIGLCALFTTPSHAVPLPPGGVIFPVGTTSAGDPTLGGVVQNDNLIDFTIDPTPASPATLTGGEVQNRVILEDASGFLTFAPRIRDTFNIDGGTLAIIAFRLEGFGMTALDVDFRTDGLGDKGYSSVSRSVSGDLMTFRYDDPLFVDSIAPGRQEESLFPSIRSDATLFDYSGSMTIFAQLAPGDVPGGELFSVTIDGLAVPMSPVPLPASALLMLGAMGALGALRRKRRG